MDGVFYTINDKDYDDDDDDDDDDDVGEKGNDDDTGDNNKDDADDDDNKDDKNSHRLPTGQWYTPSALINDALIMQ